VPAAAGQQQEAPVQADGIQDRLELAVAGVLDPDPGDPAAPARRSIASRTEAAEWNP
jgi:hypothetical protein